MPKNKMDEEFCDVHPTTELVVVKFCPKCRGGARSKAKARSSRRNGKLPVKPGSKPRGWPKGKPRKAVASGQGSVVSEPTKEKREAKP